MAYSTMIDGLQTRTATKKPSTFTTPDSYTPPATAPLTDPWGGRIVPQPTGTGARLISGGQATPTTTSPVTTAPTPYGGGGGGAYGGAYTGAPASAPAPGAPAAPPAPGLNLADLEAALAAIEAKYGLSKEQLLSDQTAAGDQYRFLLSMLSRSRQDALRGSTNEAIGRGVLRSGIYLEDQARISNEFSQQQAAAEAENASRLRAIQDALVQLDQQLAQDKVKTTQEVAGVGLNEAQKLAAELALD